MDLYAYLTEGKNLTLKQKKDLASVINAGTGRGNMGSEMLEKAAPFLTLGLFSPRLIASRVAFLNPVYYAKLSGPARKEAARSLLALVGEGTALLFLAKQMGAEVSIDPRNSDFGKIKFGDTRIDIFGGLQQYVVNGYRVAKGESVSSTTGEVKRLEGGFAKQSRLNILEDFGYGKLAPVPGLAKGSLAGKKGDGTEFDEAGEAGKIFLPLGLENAYEGFKESPVAGGTSLALGSVGFGVQTYGPGKPKPKPARTRQERQTKILAEEKKNAKKLGLNDVTPQVREAVKVKAAIEAEVGRLEGQQRKRGDTQVAAGKRFKLTTRQKAAATLSALRKAKPAYYAQAKAQYDQIKDDPDELKRWLNAVRDETYGAVMEDWHRHVNGTD
jgi:hypothetical protein